jgi:glycosyltransferase involved in cell wall biosynthesis
MKLLFFSPYFYPYTSGVTTLPYKILTKLAATQEVTVLTFAFNRSLPPTEIHRGLTIIRMPYLFKISKGFISPQSLMYFFRHSQRHDKIITNLPNVEGTPLVLIAKLMNKPVVSIFHCRVFLTTTLFARILSWLLLVAESIQLSLSTKIIGYTQDYLTYLGILPRHQAKTTIITPPVNQVPSPTPVKGMLAPKTTINIGFAGRTSHEKGLEYLIKALSHLSTQVNRPFHLIMAGPFGQEVVGEYDYYRHLLTLLKKSRLSYQFLGNLNRNQLAYFYHHIDVLVLPSINSTEAFGMVQAEAMLSNTPVIASDLPGVRVPVQTTGMGLLVPPRDSSALAAAIQDITRHRAKYVNPATRQKVKTFFDNQQNLRAYVDTITSN